MRRLLLWFVLAASLLPSQGLVVRRRVVTVTGDSSPITLVSKSAVAGVVDVTDTTAGINTSTATLLVIALANYGSGTGFSCSDNKGNDFSHVVSHQKTAGNTGLALIAYAYEKSGGGALVVGAGHTATCTWTTSARTVMQLRAYKGSKTDSSVFVASSYGSQTGAGTTVPAGMITPGTGDLFVTALGGSGKKVTRTRRDHTGRN